MYNYKRVVLIVTLWEKRNKSGKKRVLLLTEKKDTSVQPPQWIPQGMGNLGEYGFDNRAASIQIEKGPLYYTKIADNVEPRVVLHEGVDFVGQTQELSVGEYPSIAEKWSSIKMIYTQIAPPVPPPTKTIPLVLELFKDAQYDGKRLTLVEDCTDLAATYGFNNLATSAQLWEGPNYNPNKDQRVRLYKEKNFDGTPIVLRMAPGEDRIANLAKSSPKFDNVISSVEFLI